MPKKYCSGRFGKQRGDVITKSTYGKNILILIKSPSGRVKESLMLTKQNNGTYKVENTGKRKRRRGTRRVNKRKQKKRSTYKRGGKRRRRRRTNKRRRTRRN